METKSWHEEFKLKEQFKQEIIQHFREHGPVSSIARISTLTYPKGYGPKGSAVSHYRVFLKGLRELVLEEKLSRIGKGTNWTWFRLEDRA